MAGSISRRGRTWCLVYDIAPDPLTNRRRQRRVGGFRTRREAEQELTRLLRERDTGTTLDPSRMTTAEYLLHWLETDVRHRVRQSSYEKYRYGIARHLTPRLGHVPLLSLRPAHVSALQSGLRDDGLSAASISGVRVVLHAALKQAVRWQLVPRNVCEAVPAPRVERHERTLWSREDLARFQAALSSDDDSTLFALAIRTGLRRGELLGLRWSDINLDTGRLTVRRGLVKVAGGVKEEGTKGRRGRALDLSPGEIALLRAHRQAQLVLRLAAGSAWQDRDLVFALPPGRDPERHPGGRAYSPTTFLRHWRLLLARAEVPYLRPHDLRHLNATLLLEAGVHPRVVQERLGHANVGITLDTYSHVAPSLGREAAALLDARLAEAENRTTSERA